MSEVQCLPPCRRIPHAPTFTQCGIDQCQSCLVCPRPPTRVLDIKVLERGLCTTPGGNVPISGKQGGGVACSMPGGQVVMRLVGGEH